MFDEFQTVQTRRRALWLAPLGLGAAALGWFKFIVLKPEELPASAAQLEDLTLTEFADSGQNLGAVHVKKVVRTDSDWFTRLTPQQYYVTRKHSTDMPYTGTYYLLKTPGIYRCICCSTALFSSDTKYDSGTGWPSFWAPIAKENLVRVDEPSSALDTGIEVLCRRCDGHLGHIFGDGPEPTGLRYCINESSLKFVARPA
jgi:peptide-methionine (R)-S-oxide reductase